MYSSFTLFLEVTLENCLKTMEHHWFGEFKTTFCKQSNVFHQVDSSWMRIAIHFEFKAVKTLFQREKKKR